MSNCLNGSKSRLDGLNRNIFRFRIPSALSMAPGRPRGWRYFGFASSSESEAEGMEEDSDDTCSSSSFSSQESVESALASSSSSDEMDGLRSDSMARRGLVRPSVTSGLGLSPHVRDPWLHQGLTLNRTLVAGASWSGFSVVQSNEILRLVFSGARGVRCNAAHKEQC